MIYVTGATDAKFIYEVPLGYERGLGTCSPGPLPKVS